MYEALEGIENLLAENAQCSNEQLRQIMSKVFEIAHEALKQEDSDRNLAHMVELYRIPSV
jgi:hypothetical protein